jgi:acetyl-CoA carboxylase biotin carboxylase subunit
VNAFLMAQAEAEAAFGRRDVYLEKYVAKPRHVEFQILGDRAGHVVHLGERDCTIQRKYQKLVEESPSPALTPKIRTQMAEMAVRAAKAVGYQNAGTVEFLLDRESGEFHFLEINARLQVEHPVTEAVTGKDLVKEQLRLAAGEDLGYRQEDVMTKGWAIECRVNAEDHTRDFAPSPGRITSYHVPGGPGIRVDSHVYEEYQIPSYYDSLISKLIAYGVDREEALVRMKRALEEYVIEGVHTTIPLHRQILGHDAFVRGLGATDFVERLLEAAE